MDHGDLVSETRQKERFFHRRVAAAGDDDMLFAKERAVARRARRDATPAQILFARNIQPTRARAGRDDDGLGAVFVLVRRTVNGLAKIDRGHVDVFDARAEALGLLAKA